METTKRNVVYLTTDEIIQRNREILLKTGGFREAAGITINRNSLEYIVEAVQGGITEKHRYYSLSQKAAAYAFYIIKKHVFVDGNKRTGISCAYFFLELNGFTIIATDDELVDFALIIADGKLDFQGTSIWFQERIEPLPPRLSVT
jgi:death on curing protein